MEPHTNQAESIIASLKKVTPISKYLAMVLFVVLPFLGGWIGYNLAPLNTVEVEKVIYLQSSNDAVPNNLPLDVGSDTVIRSDGTSLNSVTDENGLYKFSFPSSWDLKNTKGYIQLFNHKKLDTPYKKGWGTNENKIEGGGVIEVSNLVEAFSTQDLSLNDFTVAEFSGKKVYLRKEGDGPEAPWLWTNLLIPIPNDDQRVVVFNVYGDTSSIDGVIETILKDFTFLEQ